MLKRCLVSARFEALRPREVPVTVKKYVRTEVPEKPEIIQRVRTVYVPEKGPTA